MKQEKDIGQFFKNKLNKGEKTASESLWEKINTSLNQEQRKRKKILFYWLIGGGSIVLLGLFLLFNNGYFSQPNSHSPERNASSVGEPFPASHKENNEVLMKISPIDSSIIKNDQNEKLTKILLIEENSTISVPENPKKKNSEKKTKKSTPKSKSLGETFSVSEKYYYYNSRDGKQVITENKKEIDSLISE